MKPTFYSLIAAAAACAMANAETAYTTPVGYVTLDVPASSDTNISPALERPTAYEGASTGISGNVISATGLADGVYATTPHYVHVTSGPLSGRRYPVESNSTTEITVDPVTATTLQAQGFATGNTFKVVPNWTLGTLFPAGAGVGSTADVFTIASFLFSVDNGAYGTNRAPSVSYFYCSGDVGNGVVAGWYDANDPFGAAKDDVIIDPTIQYFIRNGEVSPNSVVITGQVPNSAGVSLMPVTTAENDVYLGVPMPLDLSLQESGLQSVVEGTNDVFTISEFVFVFDDTASVQNEAPSAAYFYCTGDVGNSVPAGWYDANDPFGGEITSDVIKAGRSIQIRKAAAVADGILSWTLPLNYTL